MSDARTGILRVGIWLVIFIGTWLVFIRTRHGPLLISLLVVFAMVGAGLRLHSAARTELVSDHLTLFDRVVWSMVLPALGALVIAGGRITHTDGVGVLGAAILYLGLGLLIDVLRGHVAFARTWGPRVLGACSAALLIGVAALWITGAGWALLLSVSGLLFVPLGVSLTSAVALGRLNSSPGWARTMAAGGAAMMAGVIVAMLVLDVDPVYVLALCGVAFVLVLATAARSNADIVLVMAMVAVVWTLTQRSVPLTEPYRAAGGERVIAALGDSFMSGEGADAFFETTNQEGLGECRRAPTAYAALLMLEDHQLIPDDIAFLACSGARGTGVIAQLRELRELQDQEGIRVELAMLSVGGNDALFGSVGRTCLLAGNCSELGRAWTGNLQDVRATLDRVYADVRGTIPNAPVLIVPYPVPISENRCGYSVFGAQEHRFLNEFTVSLNRVVEAAADEAGFAYVDDMEDAFADHRLCDGPAGEMAVNFLAANSVVGTLEQSINPTNWVHNSLHPNRIGHELMREIIVGWLDEHGEALAPAAAPASMSQDLADAPDDGEATCMGRLGKELVSCTDEWSRQAIGRALLTKGPLGLVLALGAWLLAIPLIHIWRRLYNVPPGPAQTMPPTGGDD
jgi:hypothetical protein